MNLLYWKQLYEKLKYNAWCIDIETTSWDGPISVIGLYRPKEGEIECIQLVRGINLDEKNIKALLKNCKLLVTFNGMKFDIPRIEEEFPGTIPQVPVLDIYLIAKSLGLNADLKTIENTFYIFRNEKVENMKGIAVNLWKKYISAHDSSALDMLLEYNKQDTSNLYYVAERLMKKIT